ncbi:MAG TPA: glycerophosphodiester phosphodiesterase family protein [Sphingomonas sp.]|nr:glycerophosphodiester phosphodiesterase family protein [Sphingomonas sp.]
MAVLSLLLAVAVALLIAAKRNQPPATPGGPAIALPFQADLVSHAGAGMPGAIYSNSREALELAVARGHRKIEIDLIETSDGVVVAAHDWDRTYLELHPAPSIGVRLRSLVGIAPNHAEFMAQPMRGGLTPFDASYLAAWLTRHPQVRIITDAKGDNLETLRKLLVAGVPRSQLVAQIYARGELAGARALGFERIIYILHRDPDVALSDVIDFAQRHGLVVTIPEARASFEVIDQFKRGGVPLYIHTINDPGMAQRMIERGAAGVYTDFLYNPGS